MQIVTDTFYMAELREMGLDVKAGNFLIPQGYIECFAMKMPKDLTTMFEETSNSIAHKADYERYTFVLTDDISFVYARFYKITRFWCYDRLKSELLKAEEEVHFEHQMMKQVRIKKKYAIAEKAETEKYLQLKEEYVCIFNHITIFKKQN